MKPAQNTEMQDLDVRGIDSYLQAKLKYTLREDSAEDGSSLPFTRLMQSRLLLSTHCACGLIVACLTPKDHRDLW